MNICLGDHNDCSLYPKCGMLWVWQEAQRRVIDLFTKTTLADIPVPRAQMPPAASNNREAVHV
jgi:DNA-binding IscR family transcriptional regulator